MDLEIIPEHLPPIAAQLLGSAVDLMAEVMVVADVSVPVPPGLDDVSAMIPGGFGNQAERFFPATADGVVLGADGAGALPKAAAGYTAGDTLGGGVVSSSPVF